MPSQVKRVYFGGYAFDVWENVYEPAEDSFLFAENLPTRKSDAVLDIGTGCGLLSVVVAEKALAVVAVDVNPYAVRCAKENAKLNGFTGKVSFIQGDLFAPLRAEKQFDLVLFNAPYLPSKDSGSVSWLERAWAGGSDGRRFIDRFIHESARYLRDAGRVLLMQSTLSDVDKTLKGFEKHGLKAKIVAEKFLPFFETIVLVQAER